MDTITCNRCQTDNKSNAKYCSGCGYELPTQKTDTVQSEEANQQAKSKFNKKALIQIIVSAIAFGLTYFAVQQFIFKPPSYDKIMMQVASELNKNCPIMIDESTRLDNAISLPNNKFMYNYTLVNLTKDEFSLEYFKENVQPRITRTVATNPQMEIYRKHKTTLVYSYKDKNGDFVYEFSVTPEEYTN